MFWPVALYESFVEREPASLWYRAQVRQAVSFGMRSTLAGIAALAWPLVFSMFFGNVTATLVLYAIAILLDAALLVIWIRLVIRYGKQASRGETFTLRGVA